MRTYCSSRQSSARSAIPRRKSINRSAFTLVEVLVAIGVICVLVAILLPTIQSVRNQANAAVCASNMRQIGNAMLAYALDNDDCLFNQRDYSRWTNASNKNLPIDPNNTDAYWGVPYAKYGAEMKLFYCPAMHDIAGGSSDSDGTVAAGYVYTCYAQNGYGGRWSGFSKAQRQALFGGDGTFCALFHEDPNTPSSTSAGNAEWIGRPMHANKHLDRLIIAQEAYEQVLDGNGDTFVAWYQWTPPNHYPDESYEWLRHNGKSNVIFGDWHVGQLSKEDQSDARWYTGMW